MADFSHKPAAQVVDKYFKILQREVAKIVKYM